MYNTFFLSVCALSVFTTDFTETPGTIKSVLDELSTNPLLDRSGRALPSLTVSLCGRDIARESARLRVTMRACTGVGVCVGVCM